MEFVQCNIVSSKVLCKPFICNILGHIRQRGLATVVPNHKYCLIYWLVYSYGPYKPVYAGHICYFWNPSVSSLYRSFFQWQCNLSWLSITSLNLCGHKTLHYTFLVESLRITLNSFCGTQTTHNMYSDLWYSISTT